MDFARTAGVIEGIWGKGVGVRGWVAAVQLSSSIFSICFSRRSWRGAWENSVFRKVSRMASGSSRVSMRPGMQITFALSSSRVVFAAFTENPSAARTPSNLFAVMQTPSAFPHVSTPRLPGCSATASATASAYFG